MSGTEFRSALDDFLADHRYTPWRWCWPEDELASGADLYEVYLARMRALNERAMSSKAFGLELKDRDEPWRRGQGGRVVYTDLTLETRKERAEEEVWQSLVEDHFFMVMRDELLAHCDRRHADGSTCQHKLPPEIRQRVDDQALALAGGQARFDAYLERWYGPFLTWRPGDDPEAPREVVRKREAEDQVRRARRALKQGRSKLYEAQAAAKAARERYDAIKPDEPLRVPGPPPEPGSVLAQMTEFSLRLKERRTP